MQLFLRVWSIVLLALFMPHGAFAQSTTGSVFTEAFGRLRGVAEPSGIEVSRTPAALVGSIINTALGILGLVAFALVLYAGGLWLTAAGNDEKVADAKKIIRSTVIGIVIVGLAYAITAFIISLVVQPTSFDV